MYTGVMRPGQLGGIVCCLGCQLGKSHLWAGPTVFARKTEEGRAFLTVSAPSSCSAAACPPPLPALPRCLSTVTACPPQTYLSTLTSCPPPLPALPHAHPPHCLWVSTASRCCCFPCYQHPAAPAFCCAETQGCPGTLQGFDTRLGLLGSVPCDQAAARFLATPACRWPSLDSSGPARILIKQVPLSSLPALGSALRKSLLQNDSPELGSVVGVLVSLTPELGSMDACVLIQAWDGRLLQTVHSS